MSYQHLASRIFGTPLMIHGPALHATLHALRDRLGGLQLPDTEMAIYRDEERSRAGYEARNGVGILNVHGKTVHRGSAIKTTSGLTGYTGLGKALSQALDDDSVHQIALIMDTPGGEVAGAFDFADQVRAAAQQKRVTAIVSDMAASAGYLIASAASEIVVSRTAYTGSIGVVMAHADFSAALEQEGVAVTYVYAGKHKVDGNPYQALPESVREDFQRQINQTYDLFVETVARNRGLATSVVRGTEAALFQGADGVANGLADRVAEGGEADELSRLFAQASSGAGSRHFITANPTGGAAMDPKVHNDGGEPKATAEFTQQQLDAAKAEGHAAGFAEGVKAERTRIAGILNCEAVEGRAGLAATLALETDMDAEQAAKVLAASPVAELKASKTDFEQAMDSEPNPDVGAGGEAVDMTDEQQASALWDGVLAEKTA